jgi:hypothetical protein
MIELLKEMLEIIVNIWTDKEITDEQRADALEAILHNSEERG